MAELIQNRQPRVGMRVIVPAIALAPAVGLFAAMFPREAMLVAGLAVFLIVVGYYRSFLLSALLFAGTITILRDTGLGPISAMGGFTIYIATGSWLVWLTFRSWSGWIVRRMALYLVFLMWALLTMVWTAPTFTGFQNILVMAAFAGALMISAEQSRKSDMFYRSVISVTIQASWLAAGIYLLQLFLYGSATDAGIGARGFALLALVGTACCLAQWRYRSGKGFISAAGIVAVIAFSLSRTAMVIGMLLFPLARWNPTSAGGWFRFTAWIGASLATLYFVITRVDVVRSRFTQGDLAFNIMGIPINASGRMKFWETTIASYQQSPWFGKGAGSAQDLIADVHGISHPHNDYLRLLHDFGLVGMGLWVGAILVIFVVVFRAWIAADKQANPEAEIHLAAFLCLIAVALTMVTDNVVVYIFVMMPLGAVVGASIGRASASHVVNEPVDDVRDARTGQHMIRPSRASRAGRRT